LQSLLTMLQVVKPFVDMLHVLLYFLAELADVLLYFLAELADVLLYFLAELADVLLYFLAELLHFFPHRLQFLLNDGAEHICKLFIRHLNIPLSLKSSYKHIFGAESDIPAWFGKKVEKISVGRKLYRQMVFPEFFCHRLVKLLPGGR